MGELGSIWLYQKDDADDLKRKLQSTLMELDEVKLEVNAAKELTMEKERQYHSLLQMACRERDEAREQLYCFIIQCTTTPPPPPPPPLLMNIPGSNNDKNLHVSDEQHIFLKQQNLQFPIANSSISESNTLSDSLFNNSYISSSPVDSMFDAETSPEFSTLSGDKNNNGVMNNHQTFVHNTMSHTNMYDHATVMINDLVKDKVLPRKGKLLEAVMEAGPLLQTLMLAGPLPSWRNPPTLQPFKIPQVTPFAEMSCSSWVSPTMNMKNQIVVGKRQRLM